VLLPIHFRFPVVSRDFDKPAPLLVPSPCLAALGSDLNPNLVNMRKELILLNSIFFLIELDVFFAIMCSLKNCLELYFLKEYNYK
jgi:hypothetical protein